MSIDQSIMRAAAGWMSNQSCFWLLLERPAFSSQLPRVDPAAGRAGGCRYGRAGLSFCPQKQGETCMAMRRELSGGRRVDTMDLAIWPARLLAGPIERAGPADPAGLETSDHCSHIHEGEPYTSSPHLLLRGSRRQVFRPRPCQEHPAR